MSSVKSVKSVNSVNTVSSVNSAESINSAGLLKIYMRSTLCLHPAEIGCALGNANSNYWQIFGVRLQGVSSDLSLTGPAVCAGIFRLSISMGKQFSTDY